MVVDFVTPVANIIIHLWDSVSRRVKIITGLEERVQSLTMKKQDLIDKSVGVRSEVELAERRGLTPLPEVITWLGRVQAAEVEANEIVDSFSKRRRYLGDCCPNCWSSYKVGKRVRAKLVYLENLWSQGDFSNVAKKSLPDPVTEMPSTSTMGMESVMKKVLSCLDQDEVGVIGLFGMGGAGKTTLMEKIYNDFAKRVHDFDVVIWAVVSTKPNAVNIQKVILKKLGLPDDQGFGTEDIFRVLNRKKFLLFLDDVWGRLDLKELGIPYPNNQNKCKLIFTTRSEAVCGEMEAKKNIKVECLPWKEAWDLFREKVGEDVMKHPEVPELAEEVVKQCGGLPLALVTIGRAMATKKTPEEWKYAIQALRKSGHGLESMEKKVLPLLKFSFDNLPNDTLRSCFLYCSLYPQDYSIKIEKLIEYWIGEGFLDECDDVEEARYKGHNLIGELKSACLLEDGSDEKHVKIHDVIHDLAIWITSESTNEKKFLVAADVGLTKAPIMEKWKEATRISLMNNELEALTETPTCPNLFTLMLQENTLLDKISNSFFQYMPLLRVLDLSNTEIEELPTGIDELRKLKYLNLSGTKLEDLPRGIDKLVELQHLDLSFTELKAIPTEICTLVELRHLNLCRAKIGTVPSEMANLVRLNHLDLRHTWTLETIPCEVIRGLSNLQVLNLYGSNYLYWKVGGKDDDDHKNGLDLAELEGLKQLNDLGISIGKVDALSRFAMSPLFNKCTRYLSIKECKALTNFWLSSTFGNMRGLQKLHVSDCHQLEELIIGMEFERGFRALPGLKQLELFNLRKLKTILVHSGCLQNLVGINICYCEVLKNITWVLHLPSLQDIILQHCSEIEEVIGDDVGRIEKDSIALPSLKMLNLWDLPKLKTICRDPIAFPSLQYLRVITCPQLKKLPFGSNRAANHAIEEIQGSKEWWDRLEWDDKSIKSALVPHFQRL